MRRWLDLLKILAVALFTTGLVDSRHRLKSLIYVIVLSLGFFGIKGGAYGLLSGGRGRILQGPGGMLKDNNDLCLALNMVIPFLVYLGFTNTDRRIRKALYLSAFLCGVAVLITGSRGGLLTLLVILTLMVLKSRQRFMRTFYETSSRRQPHSGQSRAAIRLLEDSQLRRIGV